ncbi:hypothetical protein EYF80_035052 [Liparis tanakae]|uniref:Uncharacterized protein n=1 Tax=Liparis tanakae TaxID=230148 RepID=A0A4Z2GN65_9TELE|nr:hypothetical protein EYF80_035052 [Liparis tanakae]
MSPEVDPATSSSPDWPSAGEEEQQPSVSSSSGTRSRFFLSGVEENSVVRVQRQYQCSSGWMSIWDDQPALQRVIGSRSPPWRGPCPSFPGPKPCRCGSAVEPLLEHSARPAEQQPGSAGDRTKHAPPGQQRIHRTAPWEEQRHGEERTLDSLVSEKLFPQRKSDAGSPHNASTAEDQRCGGAHLAGGHRAGAEAGSGARTGMSARCYSPVPPRPPGGAGWEAL